MPLSHDLLGGKANGFSMFFQLMFIHLFRPFLKYRQPSSPLPTHVSPRRFCTHAATMISKLLRLYKRTHGLRQICNIAVYIAHSACTVHLLNLPEKNAARDIVHGIKHLEEICESWLCARRTLGILGTVARRWKIQLPDEALIILERTDARYGTLKHDHESPSFDNINSLPLQLEVTCPAATTTEQSSSSFSHNNIFNDRAARSSSAFLPNANRIDDMVSAPPQPVTSSGHQAQQKAYVPPQVQQNLWNEDAASGNPVTQEQMSPSMLFGGAEALVEESQNWWLKDQVQFFDSWYAPEQVTGLVGNGCMNNSGISGYGNNPYSLNVGDDTVRGNGTF